MKNMLTNIITNLGGHTGYNILAYNMISGLRRKLASENLVFEDEVCVIADQHSTSRDPILSSNIQKTNITRLAPKTIALFPFSKMMDFHAKYRIGFPMYEGSKLSKADIAFLNTLDHVVSPCDHLTKIYKDSLDIPVNQIEIGIDTNIYRNYTTNKQARDHSNPYTPTNPCIFLMLGKFETRKSSVETLIAFLKFFEEHPLRDSVVLKLKWLTHGYARNLNDIKQTTNNLFKMYPRASKRVVFLDNPREDVVRLYNEADCFLFPSRAEGVGLPLLEAMACELPCITTPYTSLSTYANSKVAIMLPDRGQVPMEDPFYGIKSETWGTYGKIEIEDLMLAFDMFLSMSMQQRLDLGANARSFVEMNFDSFLFGERLLNFVRSI